MNNETFQLKPFIKTAVLLALPIAGQRMVDVCVNLLDNVMLGSYGDAVLSASSLANAYYNLYHIICMGISMGACVLASQFWGKDDKASYRKVIALMLRVCVAVGAFFILVTALFPSQIMSLYTNDPSVIENGAAYLKIILFTFFFHGLTCCMGNILRSAGLGWIPFVGSCIAMVTNLLGNYALIFGHFGFPEMKIRGAALGTLIARVVECVVLMAYVLIYDKRLHLRLKDLFTKVEGALWRAYIAIGVPVIVSDGLTAVGNNIVSMVVGKLGVEYSAANSILSTVSMLTNTFNMGISTAACVVVGWSIGAGSTKLARKQGYAFAAMSAVVGVLASGILLAIAPMIIGVYNISETARAYAMQLMYSFAISVVFQATGSMLTKGVLRGGGDTRFLLFGDVIFLWCASIPLGYLAGFVWHLSPFWIQLLLKIDLPLKSVLCIVRMRSGKWIRRVV